MAPRQGDVIRCASDWRPVASRNRRLNKSTLKFNFVSDLFFPFIFPFTFYYLAQARGINSRNFILFISLVLPDEGFTINRKLAAHCSSFTPNPFPDVISQVYISPTPEEWIKSLPCTVYGSTWRDSSHHSTSLQVLIPPSRTWGGDGAPRTTSLR